MNRSVNETQLRVLRWIAGGANLDNPPSDSFKTSAVALKDQGLVDVNKHRGKWNATISEAGIYYLEHGRYPKPERSSTNLGPAAAWVTLQHSFQTLTGDGEIRPGCPCSSAD